MLPTPPKAPLSFAAKAWIIYGIVQLLVIALFFLQRACTSRNVLRTYNASGICDDAFEKNYDFRDQKINHFDVPLKDGCFGGFVYFPKAWHSWNAQPTGDQKDFWFALWPLGESRGHGPYGKNPNLSNIYANTMRTQGHGTLRFYSNDVVSQPAPKTAPKSGAAERPDALDRKDETSIDTTPGLTPPRNIAKVEPDYTEEARKVHFNDAVVVDVIIGEDGRVHDIKFPDPPGYGLDEQIIKALHQWKFRPAQKDGKAVAVHATIDITFKTN